MLFSAFTSYKNYLPAVSCTPAGLILALAIAVGYFFIASPTKDIIALVIFGIASALLLIFFGLILIWSRKLKNACKFELHAVTTSITSNQSALLNFIFRPFALPPLCELELSLKFEGRPNPELSLFTSGATSRQNSVNCTFIFPHRGQWKIDSVQYRLMDNFGLFRYHWQKNDWSSISSIKVLPQSTSYRGLSLLTSTYREGDTLPLPKNRKGDYFDFRRYQPGDGSRRILWKVYARSQNLLARHPEESVAPAGLSVLYCLGLAADDKLASAYISYLKQLEKADIDIIAGCLGASAEIANDSASTLELVTQSAFKAGYKIDIEKCYADFTAFLDNVTSNIKGAELDSVILFVSSAFFYDSDSLNLLLKLSKNLEQRHVRPVFCHLEEHAIQTEKNTGSGLLQILRNSKWLFSKPTYNSTTNSHKNQNFNEQFLTLCRSRNWELQRGNFL